MKWFVLVLLLWQLVLVLSIINRTKIKQIFDPKDKSFNFKLPIVDVIKHEGHSVEDYYDRNLFDISKQLTGYDQTKISLAFQYTPDLNNYILKHSYLEVIWCFKLYKEMTFYKTFEKIKAMEPSNQFTIYSATGTKPWPSKNNPRHVVCDTISKQPISSGLYEHFLVPARCKALHVSIDEFRQIQNLYNLQQLATRLEFAQALHIELVEKRLKPKVIQSIVNKLKTMSFDLLLQREDRAIGSQGNAIQIQSPIFKLMSDSYHVSQQALLSVTRFYTQMRRKVLLFNNASFKSIAHFVKTPKPYNTSFGEIFENLNAAMIDLDRVLKIPLILALDQNHIHHSIINKTLLNVMISIAKEPRDILMTYYEMTVEQQRFIEAMRMSKFHILISQSSIRLEHLSLDFFASLLKKQTVQSLRNATLKYNHEDVNNAYIRSVKQIIVKSTLTDFLRIYHKNWTSQEVDQKTLLMLAINQGLTGNEFLQAYGMNDKNLSEITVLANYTIGKLKREENSDLRKNTLQELANLIKNRIAKPIESALFKKHYVEIDTSNSTRSSKLKAGVLKFRLDALAPEIRPKAQQKHKQSTTEVAASSTDSRGGPTPVVVIVPVLICVFGSIGVLAGWIYFAKRKERSAW